MGDREVSHLKEKRYVRCMRRTQHCLQSVIKLLEYRCISLLTPRTELTGVRNEYLNSKAGRAEFGEE